MRISFKDKKLEKFCNQRQAVVRKFEPNNADMLEKRMSEIEFAVNVSELRKGNPHQLTGDRAGKYAVSLAGGVRLVFAPDQKPVPVGKGGGIDWSAVTSVCITFIGNYHG